MQLTKNKIYESFKDKGLHPACVSIQRWAEGEYEFGYARTTVQLEHGYAYSIQTIKGMNLLLKKGGEFYIKPKNSLGNDYCFGVELIPQH